MSDFELKVKSSEPRALAVDATVTGLQTALAEKDILLKATFESISQGVIVVGPDSRVSAYNDKACELLDMPASVLDKHPTLAELSQYQLNRGDFGPDVEKNIPVLHHYLQQTRLPDLPPNYIRTTRSGRVLDVRTQPLATGGLVRTFTDITHQTQTEEARERLHELLKASQAIAQVGGWEVDLAANKVVWTDEVYRMLDTEAGTFVPTTANVMRFFTPESTVLVGAAIKSGFKTGLEVPLEIEMLTATGRSIWVQAKGRAVKNEGRLTSFVVMVQDVTARKLAEQALQASEETFKKITAQVPGMVFRLRLGLDGTRTYTFVSEGVRDLYGVSPEAVMANNKLLGTFRHPDDGEVIEADLVTATMTSLPLLVQFRIKLADGTVKWVQISSICVSQDDTGQERSGVMTDITQRKLADAQLQESEERWKLALDSTGDGVWDWYIQSGREVYSKRYKEMYGYAEDKIWQTADEYVDLVHPDDKALMIQNQEEYFQGKSATYQNEHRVRCADGSWKWVLTRGMVISRDATGKPLRMIGTHTDISSRKSAEALVWQQANFDALTGLPNRRMLRKRLEDDMKACIANGQRLVILFIDLDHFKEVNDTLGHDKGDMLLIEAGRRIRERLRDADIVARMGGDEFTVVLSDMADNGRTQRIAEGILGALSTVFQLDVDQVFVSASIGITNYPQDATEVESLFKNADQALYVAKGAGRNRFSFFTPDLKVAAQMRSQLAQDLRLGMANHQFHILYQPIVELATGAIQKAEALIRWQHPTRGQISPSVFVPIAETSGLIIDMGDWAFHEVALQTRRWRTRFQPNFQVSVNKSPAQFHHDGGSNQAWLNHLEELGLPGESIVVEITEGLLLEASAGVNRQLLEMRDAGIQVSLDDFGTGYSSLSYLQKFDIDYIKIDQSFVRNLKAHSTDLALCKAMIVMAHELGIKVIAEGIESTQQRDLLMAAGCDFGQGFLFSEPMSPLEFEAFMERPLTVEGPTA